MLFFNSLCLIVQGFRLRGCYDFPGNGMFTLADFSSVDLLTHWYRKMAEMRRPMDFWKGMVLSSNIHLGWQMTYGFTKLCIDSCTIGDLCCLSHVWSIRLCKSYFSLLLFAVYISSHRGFKGNLRYPSLTKELANILGKLSVRLPPHIMTNS